MIILTKFCGKEKHTVKEWYPLNRRGCIYISNNIFYLLIDIFLNWKKLIYLYLRCDEVYLLYNIIYVRIIFDNSKSDIWSDVIIKCEGLQEKYNVVTEDLFCVFVFFWLDVLYCTLYICIYIYIYIYIYR